jgi:hypothetical protein
MAPLLTGGGANSILDPPIIHANKFSNFFLLDSLFA